MYQETIQQLYHLWTVAVRERDEARERLQQSLIELSELKKLFNNILLSEEYDLRYPETDSHNTFHYFSGDSSSQFSFVSPLDFASFPRSSPGISDSGVTSDSYFAKNNDDRSNQTSFVLQNSKDYETVVLENLGGGKMLPEKGKLLQAVIEAGPLLECLLITGPVPKWRNPPVQLSGQRPVLVKSFGQSSDSWSTGDRAFTGRDFGSSTRSLPGKRSRFSLTA